MCTLFVGGSGGDGGFADSASDRATVFGADAARTPVKPGQVKKVKISAGHVLGFDALNNDICTGTPTSPVCMYVCVCTYVILLTYLWVCMYMYAGIYAVALRSPKCMYVYLSVCMNCLYI